MPCLLARFMWEHLTVNRSRLYLIQAQSIWQLPVPFAITNQQAISTFQKKTSFPNFWNLITQSQTKLSQTKSKNSSKVSWLTLMMNLMTLKPIKIYKKVNQKTCNHQNQMMMKKQAVTRASKAFKALFKKNIIDFPMQKNTKVRKQEKIDVARLLTTWTIQLLARFFQTSLWVCSMVQPSLQAFYGKIILVYSH